MIIKSTRDLGRARASLEAEEASEEASREVSVDEEAVTEEAIAEVSNLVARFGRNGRLEEVTIRTNGDDPALDSYLQGVAVWSAEPTISFQRTGAGVALGGIGGLALGSILNETMKMGVQSGNPLISTFAIACGLAGAGVGGAVGARLIDVLIERGPDGRVRAIGTSREA